MDVVYILLAQVSLYFDFADIGALVALQSLLDALWELIFVQLEAINSLYVIILGFAILRDGKL